MDEIRKKPMRDFTEVTEISDTARIIGLQDDENVKIPLQSLFAQIQQIDAKGEVISGDFRSISGSYVSEVTGVNVRYLKNINIIENNDNSIYQKAFINSENKKVSHNDYRCLVKPLKIKKGNYKTNIFLNASNRILLLDKNGVVIKFYTNKGSSNGSNDWYIVADNDCYLMYMFSVYQTVNLPFIITPENIYNVTDSVFLPIEDYKINESEQYLINAPDDFKNAVLKIEMITPTIDTKIGANFKKLFISFIRVKELNNVTSTIVQIGGNDNGEVGVNKNTLSTFIDESETTIKDGILSCVTNEVNNSGLRLRLYIDVSKLNPSSLNVSLSNVEINTELIYNDVRISTSEKQQLIALGDSTEMFEKVGIRVGDMLGIKSYSLGIGGSRMSSHNLPNYDKLSFYNYADAINSGDFTDIRTAIKNLMDEAEGVDNKKFNALKDVYDSIPLINWAKITKLYVMYGTNDFTAGVTIGNEDSVNTSELNGALNYGIGKILSKYPKIKIYVITPNHRYIDKEYLKDSDNTPVNGNLLIDFVDNIKKVSSLNHLPCFDAYRHGGFNKYNHKTFFTDGVHYNDLGAETQARCIYGFINTFK